MKNQQYSENYSRFRMLRESKGLKQKEVSNYFGVARTAVYAWEIRTATPNSMKRSQFLRFFVDKLGGRENPAELISIWEELCIKEWEWPRITGIEWNDIFRGKIPYPYEQEAGITIIHQPGTKIVPTDPLPQDEIPELSNLPDGSKVRNTNNPLFTGRVKELKALASLFNSHSNSDRGIAVIVSGPGGFGKTQLALDFAHRYGGYFPGGVYWLSFTEPEDFQIRSQIAEFGRDDALKLPDFSGKTIDEQYLAVYRALETPTRRLLIFDDCPNEYLLAKYRPKTGGCHIIVTSRSGYWDKESSVSQLKINVMERQDSIALLQRYVPEINIDLAESIANIVGDLPIALRLAGKYLDENWAGNKTAHHYLIRLQQAGVINHPSMQRDGDFGSTGYIQNLHRIFRFSYYQLNEETDIGAISLLAFATSFVPGEPIPRSLLLELVIPKDDQKAPLDIEPKDFTKLIQLGLFDEMEDKKRVQVHQLLVAFIEHELTKSGWDLELITKQVEDAIYRQVVEFNLNSDVQKIKSWQNHFQHMCVRAINRKDFNGALLSHEFGKFLHHIGEFKESVNYLEKSLDLHEKLLDDHRIAEVLSTLGGSWQAQENFDEARVYHEQALQIRIQKLGEDHPQTAISYFNLSGILQMQGRFIEALPKAKRVHEIFLETLGANHMHTIIALINWATILKDLNRFDEAEPLLEKSFMLLLRTVGLWNGNTAAVLNNLGELAQAKDDFKLARHLYEQALELMNQIFEDNPEHKFIQEARKNLDSLPQDGLG